MAQMNPITDILFCYSAKQNDYINDKESKYRCVTGGEYFKI